MNFEEDSECSHDVQVVKIILTPIEISQEYFEMLESKGGIVFAEGN